MEKTLEGKYINNARFLTHLDRVGAPSRDKYKEIDKKKSLLRAYGYEFLYVKKGGTIRMLPLNECKDERISRAIIKTINNARKQAAKFEASAAGDANRTSLVQLTNMLESEIGLSGDRLDESGERTGMIMDSTPDYILAELTRSYGSEVMGEFSRN